MYKRLKIGSNIENLRIVENAIDEVTGAVGVKQDDYGKIMVATLEAVNNAIKHGNRLDPGKIVDVQIDFRDKNITITVTDEGAGFKPETIPDPTLPENIEGLSGRGVFLMSKLADSVKYNKKGNSVTMCFREVVN